MSVHTISLGSFHVAHLHIGVGIGQLVGPHASEDVWLGAAESVHWSAWSPAIRTLLGMGWAPSEGQDGGTVLDGVTLDGRPILSLYADAPIISEPTLVEHVEAFTELSLISGLISTPDETQHVA